MKLRLIEGHELAGEVGRRNAKRARPALHALARHTAEAVFDLRDERVVFEAQPLGELDLRQPGLLALPLQPGAGALAKFHALRNRLFGLLRTHAVAPLRSEYFRVTKLVSH